VDEFVHAVKRASRGAPPVGGLPKGTAFALLDRYRRSCPPSTTTSRARPRWRWPASWRHRVSSGCRSAPARRHPGRGGGRVGIARAAARGARSGRDCRAELTARWPSSTSHGLVVEGEGRGGVPPRAGLAPPWPRRHGLQPGTTS
jgi:hypothetical protein